MPTWKRALAVLLLFATVGTAPADGPKVEPVVLPLTLFDVLHFAQQGMKDDEILTQLRQTKSTFKVAPNDVAMMKLFGLSDRVVKAMTEPAVSFASDPSTRIDALQPVSTPTATPSTSAKPIGSWIREAGPLTVHVKITEDRITGEATFDLEGERATVSFDADYSVNREGLLYGVVTGIDCDQPEGGVFLQMLAGHAFSMRCRCDGDVMSVRDVKFCGSGLKDNDDEMAQMPLMAAGRYRKDDGKPRAKSEMKMPAPRKNGPDPLVRQGPPDAVVPAVRREIVPQQAPVPFERPGFDFNTPPPFNTTPPVPPAPPSFSGSPYAPPPMHSSMLPPQTFNVPIPAPAPQMVTPVKAGPVGNWVRERPGVRVKMVLTERRLKIDVEFAMKEGKETQRGTWRFDADCSTSPDGTLFGVITGAELIPPDDMPADKAEDVAVAGKMANKLVGEMFRCRFRVEDGELSIRDIKMSLLEGNLDEDGMASMNMVFGGRYKAAGDKPMPAVKPGVLLPQNQTGGMTLPSSQYLNHPPQYYRTDSASPAP